MNSFLQLVLLFLCCTLASAAAAFSTVSVRFVLSISPAQFSSLESHLYRVADHTDQTHYGEFLSHSQIAEFVSPSDFQQKRVQKWLISHGVDSSTIRVLPTGDYIDAKLPSQFFQQLREQTVSMPTAVNFYFPLSTELATKSKSATNTKSIFPQCRTVLSNSQIRAKQAGLVLAPESDLTSSQIGTPANQRLSYQIPPSVTGSNSANLQAVWGTGTYGFAESDMKTFYNSVNLPLSELNYLTAVGMAGTYGGDNFGEASLDVQQISSIATNIQTQVINSNNASGTEWDLEFGTAFLQFVSDLSTSLTPLPKVLSISLGSLSWDSCNIMCSLMPQYSKNQYTQQQCEAYMQTQRQVCMYASTAITDQINYEFIKLGLRGVSIVAATGDGGFHFSFTHFTGSGMAEILNKIACDYGMPTFPAESPYVTGVGGSDWSSGGLSKPEAWVASGSGVSWRFARPAYQNSFVTSYTKLMASSLPPLTAYNSTNRMYPDVAALATQVPLTTGGKSFLAGGTSASAPEFGALISLINDHRLNNGLKQLGFINPRLYAAAAQHYSELFTDMTVGNSACDSAGYCCTSGFPAAVGYDATTGLGQPLYPGFLKYFGSD